MKDTEKTKKTLLRNKAEDILRMRSDKTRNDFKTEVDMLKLIHELQVHQIELELQNEELTLAKQHEELAKEKYNSLFDFAPSGYFTLTSIGKITQLNLTGAKMLGKNRGSLLNKRFADFITYDCKNTFNDFLSRTLSGKSLQNCEVSFDAASGRPIFSYLNGIMADDGIHCLITATDITHRQQAEFALKQSEAKYRQLAESSTSIVYRLLLKPELKFDYISPSATAITGYTPEDHYNDPHLGFKLVHPDDRILLENTVSYSKGEPLELRWIRKDGQIIWTEQRNNLLYDEKNEPYALEGNARDITDRKNSELGLLKDVERNTQLINLFAQAPVLTDKELFDKALDLAVKLTDSKIGFFHQVSDNQQEIMLTTWNEEAKKNCTANYDQHYPIEAAGNWADCIRQKKAVVYNDFKLSKNKKGLPEGHTHVSRFMSIPVIQDDKVLLIFGVGNKSTDYTDLDITQIQGIANELHKILEKRKIEQTLRLNEDRWHFAVEGSNDGIWDWNLLTGDVFFSNRWKEMLGYQPDEIEGKIDEWKKRVHPDDLSMVMAALQSHFKGENLQYESEHRLKSHDGSWKWIFDRGKVLEWTADCKPARMVGTHTDITSRKLMEKTLQLSEKRYRTTIESIGDAFFSLDNELIFTYFNKQAEALLLKQSSDVLGKKIFDEIFQEAKGSLFEEKYRHALAKKQVCEFETFFETKPFTNWYNVRVYPGPEGISVFFTIVTEKKKAEQLLLAQKNQLNKAQEIAHLGSWELDVHSGKISWSDETYRILGYSPQEFPASYGVFLDSIHPNDREAVNTIYSESIHNDRVNYEIEHRIILKPTGELRWVYEKFEHIRDQSGAIVRSLGSVLDITDHKLAEEKLKESEVQYRNLADSGAALIWTSGTDKLCNYFNDPWLKFTGRTLNQELGNGWAEGVHPDDFDKCLETYVTSFDKNEAFSMEYRLRHESGEYRWLLDLGTPNFNSKGEFVGYIGHCFDISERKQIELALHESEEKYRSIFESVQEVYFEASMDGTLLEVSPSIDKITKGFFSRSEMIGQSFKDIYAYPNERDTYFSKLFEHKRVNDYELSLRNKDGSIIPVAVSSALSFDTNGIPVKITGILRDITERKNGENALNETLKKLNDTNLHLEKRVEDRTMELRKLSDLQQAILRHAGLAIISTSTEGLIELFNEAAEEMLGYKSNEVVGICTPVIFHEPKEMAMHARELSLKTGETVLSDFGIFQTILKRSLNQTSEWSYVRKGGEIFPVRLTISSIKDYEGQLLGYIGIADDITKEKESISALRESEERFQSMFYDHAAILLLINPETGEIIEANKAAEQFYGLPFNSEPKLILTDINVSSLEEIKQKMNDAITHHRNYFIFPHKLASGEIRTVEVHSTPIDVRGKKVLFSIIHDITERTVIERALVKSETENRAIIQAVPDLMFRINRTGTYLDYHSQNESSLYVPKEYFVGKKVNEVLPPELASESMLAIEKAFNTNKVVQYEYSLPVQGKESYFENRIIPISEDEVLAIIRDITDRKTAEIDLQDVIRKLSTLIQNLQAGTLFENNNRHISLVNQSYCDFFNIQDTPEQLVGCDSVVAFEKSKLLLKDPHGFMERIEEILSKGEIILNDELFLLDGRILERDYIPIKHENDLIGHLWQYRNITQRKQSENALKMQNAAFESFALAIIITDINGRIQWANSAFTKLTGYSVDEALGKMPGELVKSGNQNEEFYKSFWETILNKKVWSGELSNRRKNGSIYYEEETITPVINSEGNISSFIAIKIDITERKRLYQELAEDKRRLADIIKGTNAGTWEWNIQTGETTFNEQWAEILGYTLDELSPVSIETWMKFAHPDDLKLSGELIEKHFKGDIDYYSFESRMKHKNGTWIWVLDRGKVHEWDAESKPLLMSGTHQDISEQKRVELALLESDRKLSSMISNISDVIGIMGADGKIQYKSPNIEIYFGWKPEDLIGTEGWLTIHPDDLERIQNEFLELLQKDNASKTVEYKYKCKDGSYKPIELTATNLVNNDIINGVLLNYHDITIRKQIQEDLIEAKIEAEKANLAKSEFLSRMSHELRTPMNSILGFAQLLEMGELNMKQRKGVTHILNNGKHLLDLINEVLDISGIESGRQILIREPVQLDSIINEITDSIQIAAYKRGVTIELVDSPANSLFALADKLRFKQVLINLLNNAIKYNNEGGLVTIKTALQSANERGNTLVRISISDTGNGIRPVDIDKLFQPFERIGADKTETEGTGLGLMVVKKLIEAMDGTIGVESVVGTGSTFWIELPVTENNKPASLRSTISSTSEIAHSKQGKTILYIEDNLSNIELVADLLEEHRPVFHLITSMHGKQTLKLAKEHKPNLILLDLDLPDIHGIEVLKNLSADVYTQKIPVIIVSADAMPFQLDKLKKAGATDYLTKPLDVLQFLRTIDKHIKD
jgi:PAS domain S-box-containing protein